MPNWTPLAEGAPIALQPGEAIAVIASVKSSHAPADLVAFAQKRGLVVSDLAFEGQRAGLGPDPRGPDYRYVAAVATATAPASLPWSVPWPASMFDDSQLVHVWTARAGGAPAPAPPAPVSPRAALMPSGGTLALLALGGALVLWGATRRRRRYAR